MDGLHFQVCKAVWLSLVRPRFYSRENCTFWPLALLKMMSETRLLHQVQVHWPKIELSHFRLFFIVIQPGTEAHECNVDTNNHTSYSTWHFFVCNPSFIFYFIVFQDSLVYVHTTHCQGGSSRIKNISQTLERVKAEFLYCIKILINLLCKQNIQDKSKRHPPEKYRKKLDRKWVVSVLNWHNK